MSALAPSQSAECVYPASSALDGYLALASSVLNDCDRGYLPLALSVLDGYLVLAWSA